MSFPPFIIPSWEEVSKLREREAAASQCSKSTQSIERRLSDTPKVPVSTKNSRTKKPWYKFTKGPRPREQEEAKEAALSIWVHGQSTRVTTKEENDARDTFSWATASTDHKRRSGSISGTTVGEERRWQDKPEDITALPPMPAHLLTLKKKEKESKKLVKKQKYVYSIWPEN